eukprot:9553-Heterococcus_DN1.PRE.6
MSSSCLTGITASSSLPALTLVSVSLYHQLYATGVVQLSCSTITSDTAVSHCSHDYTIANQVCRLQPTYEANTN